MTTAIFSIKTLQIIGLLALLIFFLVAPFLVAALIWYLLLPVGFWETIATVVLMVILFLPVAFLSWVFGFILLVTV